MIDIIKDSATRITFNGADFVVSANVTALGGVVFSGDAAIDLAGSFESSSEACSGGC